MEDKWRLRGNEFRLPLQLKWDPKEDITTYELSMCLPILLGSTIYDKEELTKEQRRHFEIIDHNKP